MNWDLPSRPHGSLPTAPASSWAAAVGTGDSLPQIHVLVTGSLTRAAVGHLAFSHPPPPHQVTAAFTDDRGTVLMKGVLVSKRLFPPADRGFPCCQALPARLSSGICPGQLLTPAWFSPAALPAGPLWGPLSSAGSVQLCTPQRASPPRQSSHLFCTFCFPRSKSCDETSPPAGQPPSAPL